MKDNYKSIISTQINETIRNEFEGLNKFDSLTKFAGFCEIIFAIVALTVSEHNTPELVLIIIYIVF